MKIKNLLTLLVIVSGVMLQSCAETKAVKTENYRIEDGRLVYNVPARAEGQSSMLKFAADPIPVVRVGFVGLGMRGPGAVERFTHIEGVEVKALCDLYADRAEGCQKYLESAGMARADVYSGEEGWKQLCERDDLDLVYICTPWLLHVPVAVYAMEHGKHVAIEVPAAMSLDECWQLVDTSERTRKHCMMLENCVYDFFELTALNMAQHGLFGEVLHVEGSYIHNLDPFWDAYQGNWRLDYNQKHRGDNYPTHGIGPVCQVLNIHRGDKMNYLVSMDTKSVNGKKLAKEKMGLDDFADGDHTVTLIRTENGKQIEIQHNVYDPRPYSRMYQLTGTEGFANKYPMEGLAVKSDKIGDLGDVTDRGGKKVGYQDLDAESFVPRPVYEALMQQYKHPIAKDIEEKAKQVGGHGGMDFIMDYRLIYCLQRGLPLDQDVYDAAEWCCLTELSGASIEHGSMPVEVPDFTRGDWNKIEGLEFAQ